MMESSTGTILRLVIILLPVAQLDEFACRQLDRVRTSFFNVIIRWEGLHLTRFHHSSIGAVATPRGLPFRRSAKRKQYRQRQKWNMAPNLRRPSLRPPIPWIQPQGSCIIPFHLVDLSPHGTAPSRMNLAIPGSAQKSLAGLSFLIPKVWHGSNECLVWTSTWTIQKTSLLRCTSMTSQK